MPAFDVVELDPADGPEPGSEASDFTRPLVTDEFWQDRDLAGLAADGGTILVFTPMVGSFVAKYVWDELAERGWHERDERVVGVSASTPYGIARFLDENEYPFSIFADPSNEVAESYGIAHDLDGMAGIGEPRLAFVAIDADRTVEAAWVATEWPEFPDYDDLEDELALD
ncbi:redoxin domain-containing protein [Halosolutus gelatinilyticus]|uniref:redoxin domain-containing protein n=1 Tax=Halosolutus gelatinilyticus TaxID=2931975 RepID=UPI001FF0E53A|nr:redoxin domain-containing protein [Halosolutus gelatinilyticus]